MFLQCATSLQLRENADIIVSLGSNKYVHVHASLSNMMERYAPGQETATACVWLQLRMPIPLWGQSVSLVSVPAQVTFFRRMGLAAVSFTENDCVITGAVERK